MTRLLLLPLLFCSGAAALVLEVAWFRRMSQVAGGDSIAMAGVLAAVIGGMAIGAWWLGPRADRSRSPLRLYGLLELGVAAGALLSPWLIGASEPLFTDLYRQFAERPLVLLAGRFALSVVLLAGPAILMGGTIPAVAAAIRAEPRARGSGIGLLYAVNTIGAVAGTLAAGFWLLPAIGLAATMRSAAILSGLAGIVAVIAGRPAGAAEPEPAAAGDTFGPAAARRAIVLFSVSGFLGLIAEVAFARSLVLAFGSTTYAFTTMLAVFLLGIGAGSGVGTLLARAPGLQLRRLETTLAATAALFALATMATFWLPRLYLELSLALDVSYGGGFWLRVILAGIVLLPGALGLGVAFPLAVHVATNGGATGRQTGRLYAANTLASIAGSSVAAFLLVPAVGPRLAVVGAALGAAVVAVASARRLVPAALLGVTAVALIPPSDVAFERLHAGVYFNREAFITAGRLDEKEWNLVDIPIVEHGDGATVSVWRWDGHDTLLVNGKGVAGNTILADDHHLRLLGHLPMLVHDDPQRVLVVGLGMGTTFRAVQRHEPAVLRVVEIEKAVVRVAARLGVAPADVVVADARTYLKATEATWDVITSDPIHPWVRGGGDLYSREYFERCRDRLAPGGVFCVWGPVYQMGLDDVKDVVRTFSSVFRTDAYYASGDLVLIGTVDGDPLPPRPLVGTARDPVSDAIFEEDLSILRVAGHEALRAAVGEGPLLTDDALRLEFSTPAHVDSPALVESVRWIEELWGEVPAPYDELIAAFRMSELGRHRIAQDAIERALKTHPQHGFVRRYAGEHYLLVAGGYRRVGNIEDAEFFLDRAAVLLGDDRRVTGERAAIRAEAGDAAGAVAIFRRLLEADPESRYLKRRIAALEKR